MASEQFSSDLTSGGAQAEEESPKPTFLNKVKAKAHQLKSKLKIHGSEDSHDEAPASGDDPQAYTKGSAGQDENRYDVPSTPANSTTFPRPQRPAGAPDTKSQGNPFGAVTSGQTAYGVDSMKTDDKSFPVDPAVLKSDGPPDSQQAVPTSYSYFNSDPEQARLPSDASQGQQNVSSTFGGLSSDLTPATKNLSAGTENQFANSDETLSKSGDRESELPRSSTSSQRDDVGLVEPSQPSEDSLLSHPIEQDEGINDKASGGRQNYDGLAGAAATAAGAGGVAAVMGNKSAQSKDWSGESLNTDAQNPQQRVFQKSLSNDGGSKRVRSGLRTSSDPELRDRSNIESEGDGFAPDVSGTAAASDLSANDSEQNPELRDRSNIESEGDGFAPNVSGTAAASDLSANDSEQNPISTKVAESAYAGKDSLASTLGYDGTSTLQAKDSAAADFSGNSGEQELKLNRGTDSANELTDTATSKLGDSDQAMSTDSTPVSQRVTDSAIQAKESAANLSTEDDDSTPFSQKLSDNAEQGKNYAADQLSNADQALSSDEKPVSEKTNETASQAKDGLTQNTVPASQAKDKLTQNTAPAQDDKSSTNSVTESVTSLPGMLASKLGLGGGSTTNSPTTFGSGSDMPASTTPTSDASNYDPSTRIDTPHPDQSAAPTPGIFDRVSGLASSLFGGGAKQPASPRQEEKSS